MVDTGGMELTGLRMLGNRRPTPLQADLLLAGVLGAGALLERLAVDTGWPLVLAPLAALPLALRRRAPLVMAVLFLVEGIAAQTWAPTDDGFLVAVAALLIGTYSTAAYIGSLPVSLGCGLLVGLGANWDLVVGGLAADDFWPFRFMFLTAAWAAGRLAHQRRLELGRWTDEALRLAQTQQAAAERAVAEERARLARELHDVIAHNVSAMVVQAGAVQEVLGPGARGDVRHSLAAIQERGRETILELRRLLGILREGDPELVTSPPPSLTRLDALVEDARAAGLTVDVAVAGQPVELPTSVDQSGYRILQEGLTNVLKHAQATVAHVRLDYAGDRIAVEVVDDGRGMRASEADGAAAGHGLLGIRERVDLYGGSLSFGDGPHGGFRLAAELPLTGREGR